MNWRSLMTFLGAWGIAGAVASVFAAGVLLVNVPPLLSAIIAPGVTAEELEKQDQARAEAQRASFDEYLRQVNGRTMFFVPSPPSPPPLAVAEEEDEEEEATPPPPARYGGPGIIAMINGVVWFDDGKRLLLGAEAEGGIRVVSLNSPWGAKVEWQGNEWDVPLFSRTTEQFLEQPEKPAEAVPQEATEPSDESTSSDETPGVTQAKGPQDPPEEKP